jgi:hypothetical protein
LSDPKTTGVCIVSTPEEMPVNEAIELAARLEGETRVHLGAVVANRVLPELFGRGEEAVFESLSRPAVTGRLAKALSTSTTAVEDVFDAARLAVRLRRSGAEHLARLRQAVSAEVPLVYLPLLFGRAHGPRAIHQMAAALSEELGE